MAGDGFCVDPRAVLEHDGPADEVGAGIAPPTSAEWSSASPLLRRAYEVAERAHRSQRRPSDGRLFLEHVSEVAGLLRRFGFDEELVAVGLLHDSVERGTLSEAELRAEMGDSICALVMTLSEDPEIEPFERRKAALRDQVAAAGGRAVTVFAADKLSDIAGLRRGVEAENGRVEARIGTSVSEMVGHYRDSVELISRSEPQPAVLAALWLELDRLEALAR